jgi:broad specificity phosphatase PhoE
MTILVLLRHGESAWNAQNLPKGPIPAPAGVAEWAYEQCGAR